MSRLCRSLFVGAAVSSLFACSESPSSPSPSRTVVIEPIRVESVVPSVDDRRPARVTIQVNGIMGGGCDELHAIEQQRQGSTVLVSITRSHSVPEPGGFCTLIGKPFDQRLALPGTFTPGQYTVQVNTMTTTFRVE